MLQIETAYEKGDKVWLITDKNGLFELKEVTILGWSYKNFLEMKKEGETEVEVLNHVLHYVFYLDGTLRFAETRDIFKTKAEAAEHGIKMGPEFAKVWEEEIKGQENTIVELKKKHEAFLKSVEDLTLYKPDEEAVVSKDAAESQTAEVPIPTAETDAAEPATVVEEVKPIPNE